MEDFQQTQKDNYAQNKWSGESGEKRDELEEKTLIYVFGGNSSHV